MFVIFSFVKWTEEFFLLVIVVMETKKMVFLRYPWQQFLNSSVYFRKLMRTSICWKFQPKATVISWEKMSQSVPLFPVTRALDPSNRFLTTRKWVKTFLIPKCLDVCDKKNSSGTSIFSVLGYFSHEKCRTSWIQLINDQCLNHVENSQWKVVWKVVYWFLSDRSIVRYL